MFWMSLKSVPGCLVSIDPMLIGVPVAATPGLVPQAAVETVPAGAELDAAGAEDADEAALLAAALDVAAGADEELLEELEELELQPATTPSATDAMTAAAVRVRQWKGLFMCSAFSWLTAS
jgi:phosphoribosylcarboxyaminoimidazole (NCAIR) mutase